jgi:hypothetical protein
MAKADPWRMLPQRVKSVERLSQLAAWFVGDLSAFACRSQRVHGPPTTDSYTRAQPASFFRPALGAKWHVQVNHTKTNRVGAIAMPPNAED